jgi:hypothetical protein
MQDVRMTKGLVRCQQCGPGNLHPAPPPTHALFPSAIAQTPTRNGPSVGDTLCASNAREARDAAHG